MTQPFCCFGSQSRPCRAAFVSYGEVDFTSRLAMHETALSRQDALDAGVRWRVVECASGLRIEEGEPQDNRYDIEQVLRLVWLALENEREVRIESVCRSDSAKKVP